MPPTVSFDGKVSATIQIGTRTIILKGQLEDHLSKKFELSYHAKDRSEAVCLGNVIDAVKELASATNIGVDAFKNEIKNLATTHFGPLPENALTTNAVYFYDRIREALAYASGEIQQVDASMVVWLTDIVLKGELSGSETSTSFAGEITFGLEFGFTGVQIFNIKLLSAGVMITVKTG